MVPAFTPCAAISMISASATEMIAAWPMLSMFSVTWLFTAARS